MTTCSVHTITTHAKHHHHPSLRFMGSGTGSHSGSGSGSNSPPPPIKTEPQEEEDCSSTPPSTPSKTPPTVHTPPVGLLNHRNLVQDEKLVVATLASLNSGDPSNIIKQDLRLIIQSRRKAEGKGELQVDFKTPPKDEQQLTAEELEKRARRRELNRLAAKRSREKGQRRKETLIQEIQGLQNRNGSLEGALASLVQERDNLVQTLKTHLPHCQDSSAMTRSAQLLAFSHRLAQLLDWTIPGPGSNPAALPSPSTEQTMAVEIQAPPPTQTHFPAHLPAHQTRESSHHSLTSPSTPLALGVAPPAFPSPGHHSAADLPSPSTHYSPAGRSLTHGTSQSEAAATRDLEIDAAAAAALREEIERRHHRHHPFRMSAPASPTFSSHSASQHTQFSPHSSPPHSHPSSLPITPTHLLPSPSRSLPPPLPSPSSSLPPFLPSPSHSLPAHLPSPSCSMPPFLPSPAHIHSPSHLPSPHSHLPSPHSHLPSPHSHLPSPHSHLPSPHSHLPSPHSHLPSPHSHLPSPHSHLPSPHSHLPSPSHPLPPHLPSPSHPFPSHLSSPSLPRPSHLALDTSGGLRDTGSQLVSFTGTPQEESCRSPLSNPALLRSPKQTPSTTSVKRPQSLDLRGAGIIPKKDPALRSPVIPKKDPALRSPVIPKKDPALRSPTIPKKDPALRSPIIESSPVPPVTPTTTSSSALRTSGVFKRGPVQRVASFHGVSAQNPGEQVTPLNLSKRRKSEDFGSMVGEQDSSGCQQTGFSGLRTWPQSGAGSWNKQEERETPLNLVCREQPTATITSSQSGSTQETTSQPKSPHGFKQEGHVSQDGKDELTSSVSQRLMRFNSYDGLS